MFHERRGGGGGGGSWKGNKSFGDRKPWDRGGFNDRGSDRPTMHSATCSDCGNSCEVPFKPVNGRPIFCSNCFKKDDRSEPKRFGGNFGGNTDTRRPFSDEKRLFKAVCDECGESCEVPFRPTGDKLVYCRDCFGKDGASSTHKHSEPNKDQLTAIHTKLDAIIKILNAHVAPKTVAKEERVDVIATAPEVVKEEETKVKVKKEKKASKKKK